MRTLGRLAIVPLGLMFAVVAAGAVLITLGLERATHAVQAGHPDLAQWSGWLDIAMGMTGMAQFVSLAPATLLVIIGEVAGIRSSVYYVAGGGVALAALPLLAEAMMLRSSGTTHVLQASQFWQIFATAGFAGGLAYWLVAGRTA